MIDIRKSTLITYSITSMQGISVVLCCHNSVQRLLETLTHLAKQIGIDSEKTELILVDNNSTDQTGSFSEKLWKSLGSPYSLHIIQEPKEGLSEARKAGITYANYQIIVFCDDDNWLDENFLAKTLVYFERNPTAAVIGAYGIPAFETQKPAWFDSFAQSYAVGMQAPKEGEVSGVFGAAMSIRKNVLAESFDIFGPLLLSGRVGRKLSAGEDSEICLRVKLLGYRILFTDQLRFKHFIPASRTTWNYVRQLHEGFNRSFIPLQLYHLLINNKPINSWHWLGQSVFYFGRACKYGVINYRKLSVSNEGNVDRIRFQNWLRLSYDYLAYNTAIKRDYMQLSKRFSQLKERS